MMQVFDVRVTGLGAVHLVRLRAFGHEDAELRAVAWLVGQRKLSIMDLSSARVSSTTYCGDPPPLPEDGVAVGGGVLFRHSGAVLSVR